MLKKILVPLGVYSLLELLWLVLSDDRYSIQMTAGFCSVGLAIFSARPRENTPLMRWG